MQPEDQDMWRFIPLLFDQGRGGATSEWRCSLQGMPNHGGESKAQDFTQSPVVEKGGAGNLVIIRQGIVRGY